MHDAAKTIAADDVAVGRLVDPDRFGRLKSEQFSRELHKPPTTPVSALDRRNGVLTPFRPLSPAERSFVDTLTTCRAKQADYAAACVGAAPKRRNAPSHSAD
jgi:hypothetical protein